MKKNLKSIITMMCLLAITTAWAGPVSESQARSIAAQFMANHALQSTNLRMAQRAPRMGAPASDSRAAYYVFNASRGGYVIVAGDDRAPAVLGYSDHGTFDLEDVPEAMQELLKGYAAQIEALDHGAQAARHLNNKPAIAPLVRAQWTQRTPYNLRMPFISGKHAPTGCVATAMSQVLYYWKWPARPTAPIPAYTTETRSIYMPQLPPVDFDWSNMRDTYETTDTTSAAGQAVATLVLYCAQSLNMDYTANSSSAYTNDIPNALTTYFGFRPDAQYIKRQYYSTERWEETLYNELAARRPVVYRGQKKSGGHSFICDGYDGNGMYHINWGWNGSSNGYFLLSVLNPDIQGVGSADDAYGYIISQAMVTGIEPGTSNQAFEVTDRYISIQNSNLSRTSQNGYFTLTVLTHFLNATSQNIGFDYGWGFYSGNTLLSVLKYGTKSSLDSQYYTKITETLTFGSGISSGTYRIIPIYSEIGANNWRPCVGSDVNYIEVNIRNNTCEATTYGSSCEPDYTINNIDVAGHLHPNRPVYLSVNMTNRGYTRNDLVYMFVDGKLYSSAFIDVEHGQSDKVEFIYLPDKTGYVYVSFALQEEANTFLSSRNILINAMPSANLTGQIRPLNVTDPQNKIITSDRFGMQINVTNNSLSTYNEDITVNLYKHTYGNYGTLVETQTQTISLPSNQTTRLQFDMENVMDRWSYFVKVYYYSSGEQISLCGTSTYFIEFPNTPSYPKGDVNCDNEVNIADVNAVIDIILGNNDNINAQERADVNGDGEINIADVNAILDIILKQ